VTLLYLVIALALFAVLIVRNRLKVNNLFFFIMGVIGFIRSIFIDLLAFDNAAIINTANITILTGSFISGAHGLLWLRLKL
jgi:Na+/H+ antiporter NhaA